MLNPETPSPKVNPSTPTMCAKKNYKTTRGLFPFPSSVDVIDVESSFLSPLSFRGTCKSDPISVEQHHMVKPFNVIELSDTEDDEDVRILKFTPKINSSSKQRKRIKGECSNSAPFVCEICTETKTVVDSFNVNGCCHVYCKECVVLYIESKLDENVVNIGCPVPGCRGLLEVDDCWMILTPQVFNKWGKMLCEAVISEEEKFYCPYVDCSAMLIRDESEVIWETMCLYCWRMFCAVCRVPWHPEISCEEFQKLNADEREREDIMLMNLAKKEKWKRCPKCRFYVAKSEGCLYMKCRCGNAFCYNCGTPNLSNSHFCTHCNR